jgi:ribokinase
MSLLVAGALHHDVILRAARLPRLDETLPGDSVAYALGGKAGNQALAAVRMGAQVAFAGAVGDDPAGQGMRATLDRAGVHTGALATVRGPSGMSAAIVTQTGGYGAVIVSAANRSFTGARVGLPAGCTHLLLQNEVPAVANLRLARAARAAGVKVIWNAAPARADRLMPGLTDILIVNRVEAADILRKPALNDARTAARDLTLLGPRAAIITLGEGGLALWDGTPHLMPAIQVPVISTHGAGDAFCGALAAALDQGQSLPEALRLAQGLAALWVSTPPDQRDRLDQDRVRALLAER